MDALLEIAEGNAGAISVISTLVKTGEFYYIDDLKTLGIRGPMIWMLYKDVCKQNIEKLRKIIDLYNNKTITKEQVLHAINNYGDGLPEM